ncbi:hypothetical protein LY78DRAFT_232266 [Colletotrichum sublineola]|nr:hypothetical protein LY78DRAFT_232266 [Colletotrichum sublineola]
MDEFFDTTLVQYQGLCSLVGWPCSLPGPVLGGARGRGWGLLELSRPFRLDCSWWLVHDGKYLDRHMSVPPSASAVAACPCCPYDVCVMQLMGRNKRQSCKTPYLRASRNMRDLHAFFLFLFSKEKKNVFLSLHRIPCIIQSYYILFSLSLSLSLSLCLSVADQGEYGYGAQAGRGQLTPPLKVN